ncbi:S8 family serine peptidase [Streptomyces sp. NPDC048248]|uniref:S8 family serine peptidase n=1 Tax=Streptomyces sp. NPDC048248 TaxID=3365523 RepID=UPI003715A10C
MSFTRTLRAVGGAVVAGALLFGAAPTALADEIRDAQWPLKAFDAESVWKESTGKGVTVAVVDDPVYGNHPDLKGNVIPGKSFIDGGRGDQESTKDHGTAMASIIAGHGHGAGDADGVMGLAPDAKILPIGSPEFGAGVDDSDLDDWIRYAVEHDASVVNMSIVPASLSDADKEALAYASQKDVLVVVGAGNDGAAKLGELASYPGVVTVGAVDKTGEIWAKSTSGSQMMLSAPGVQITSASSERSDYPYRRGSGTSDSTAYVSAAAALLRSKFPDLTAGQIANRLVKTAALPKGKEDLQLPDPHYGYGIIRPYSALTQEIPAGSKNGPLKTPKTDPAGGAAAPGASGGDQASEKEDSGLGIGAIVGIAAGVLVVVVIIAIVIVVARKKDGHNGPPPGGPGGFGGPGGPGFPQQPGPYAQQPGPYQQQPGGPSFPPAPPAQPPGQ